MELSELENLFSLQRLEGYATLHDHENNFALIAAISHKIGILEVIIRNKIDFLLSQRDKNWWQHLPAEIHIVGDVAHTNTLVSKQSLGFWIKVVEHFKIHNQIFSLDFLHCIDFKRYCHKNKNRFNNTKDLRNYQKATIILRLLHTLRNRAFHFENLYKYTPKGYPRLNTKIGKNNQELYIALQPDRIPVFLNDLLESFHPELVRYADKTH
ncbi:CAAX protease [Helicobacter sp. NHP21005]|uniref:hypothetical protein n=1 Tax=Helicobacter felistomachi TaxID=3040201 RepID=UPI002572923D|nr:hypothetical protein [Helicobacter sp. NHP21005]BEG57261.1 CAAX protease [Helicobacter sp. NHP21005]